MGSILADTERQFRLFKAVERISIYLYNVTDQEYTQAVSEGRLDVALSARSERDQAQPRYIQFREMMRNRQRTWKAERLARWGDATEEEIDWWRVFKEDLLEKAVADARADLACWFPESDID